MTEKTLLLRCATSEPFFIISTDLPSARVFDTSSSKLLSVVEVPKRSQGHALSTMSLKSVAITTLVESATSFPTKARGASKARAAVVEGEQIRECYAAIGLSDGTVVIRNITKGTPGQHVAVSETQHPIVSMAFCDAFLFCLSENGFFYVVDVLDSANGTCLRVRTPAEASAVQVTRWVPDGGEDASSAQQGYQVLVAGPTNAVFIVHQQGHSRGEAPRLSAEKSISFASQGPAVDYVWLSGKSLAANGSIPAATASAQEGVVRLWDVRPEAKHGDSQRTHSALVARCRRTLLCGQRIASLSVQEGKTGAQVVATTFTGCVLMWCLDGCVIPSTVEPTPLPPTIALVSAVPQGRLLYGAVIGGGAHSADAPLTDVSLLLLRGRFALPMFECLHVASAMEQYTHRSGALAVLQAQRKVATLSSLGYGAAASITVVEVPLETSASSPFAASEGTIGAGGDTVGASFQVMDHLWLQHQHRVAAKAMLTPTESFEAIRAYHASSMKDLPVKQLTLEQRLREVARRHNPAKHVAAGEEGQVDGALPDGSTEQSFTLQHSLGMATVPLYQALHANDVSSVMDLLSLAARSNEGIRSVVTALHLPYCLQLLSILSERLGMCSTTTVKGAHSGITVVGGSLVAVSTRSPMLRWISAIVQHRGMELYAVQREASSRITPAATSEAQKPAARLPDGTSPPAHFLAPVLHQYRSMCSQYDKLATLYGRLSIFSAARPSEKNQFVNRSRKMMSSNLELGLPTNNTLSSKRRLHSDVLQDDLLFPAMFAEVRTKSRAPRTVRVRSRVAMELKRRAKATSDAALLRQAQQTKKDGDGASPLDDDNDEAMERIMEDAMHEGDPLEALDAMGLDSDKDSIDSDDEEEECEESASGEDDDSDVPARRKKARHEDVMLADEHSEEDDDAAELDSDEAEFSEGSDDDVVSSILDGDGSDEESSSDDEEEDDDDGDNENGKDDDESSDDSGLGDDMKELLEQHADQSDKQAKRQFKKVRTD